MSEVVRRKRDHVLEAALRDSFVVEAIALKAGLDKREVRDRLTELTSNAFIGQAAMLAGPETAGVIAAIAEEMFEPTPLPGGRHEV